MTTDKRLPDGPGMWYSDDGQECYISRNQPHRCRWPNSWFVRTAENWDTGFDTLELALDRACIRPARWRKAEAPTFGPMPPKPNVYLCYTRRHEYDDPKWRVITDIDPSLIGNLGIGNVGTYKVIPHRDNDPEAVRLIEEARYNATLAS